MDDFAKDTDVLISRQAALDICNSAIDLWKGQLGEGLLTAVRDKIVQLPPTQPEITLEQAIDKLHAIGWMQEHDRILTASAQRKTGKWIYPTDINGFGRCPHCKALWDYGLISNPFFKFCPKCGDGEMRSVQNE